MTLKLLVSVRSVAEASLVAEGGADFIDLKEPKDGALGGLPLATIADIVGALRAQQVALPVSATIGDRPMIERDAIVEAARAVAACGVDYVKVGIEAGPGAAKVLAALAALPFAVVPVFIADHGLDFDLVRASLGFPAVMADTADKLSGSLFDCVGDDDLRRLVATVRGAGRLVGLAGALRLEHLPRLFDLQPDFAGFRSAVCSGSRAGALDPARLAALVTAVRSRRSPRPG